jgi:hypothetical protein
MIQLSIIQALGIKMTDSTRGACFSILLDDIMFQAVGSL